jgi:hypothetical protein
MNTNMLTTFQADPINEVENRLNRAFQRVQPSRKFVQTVRSRINFSPSITIADRLQDSRRFIFAVGGVLTAGLLIATGVRAIFYLVYRWRS